MSSKRTELQNAIWSLRFSWVSVAIFSGTANLLMLAPTLYMLQVYDRVLISLNEMTLLWVSLITVFLLASMAMSEILRSRVLVRVGKSLEALLSERIFSASFKANALQANPQPAKAFGDLLELRQFLTGHGVISFLDAPWTPIYIAVLFLLHPFLGWVALVFALFQAALAWWGHRRAVAPALRLHNEGLASVDAMRSNLRQVEAFFPMGMWNALQKRWMLGHASYHQAHAHSHGLNHRLSAISKGLRYSQQSLSLAAGAWLVIHGDLSVGAMIAGNVLTTRALAPVDQMVGLWRQWLGALSAYRRIDLLLQTYPSLDRELQNVRPQGGVSLKDVSVYLSGREKPILDHINLDIPPGTVTVVVGPSGSGKSSLAKVMLGVWPQTSGDVFLDGDPIDRWSRSELGPFLGFLPQSVDLFEGSVAQNIARFEEVNSSRVVSASEQADLHGMLLKMPQGYDTPVGVSGDRLSGGQRQRIGLARALYGDPALLVLDEPNAHLDDAGEAALALAVKGMKSRGQTVVVITHRPGIVSLADNLVMMQSGRVVWHGPRDQGLQQLKQLNVMPAKNERIE
jgi:ATP-binding cassette, subfamily C, bacterial exporter for protease/lipase